MRINVFKFECLEGDNSFKKEEYFGRPELMNEYINEFVREKLTEGWTRNEKGEYCCGNSEKYAIITQERMVHN